MRHSALFFPIISVTMGVYLLLTQCEGIFGGLGAIAAVLWFINGAVPAWAMGRHGYFFI